VKGEEESWRLLEILIPMHAKIRLSFAALRRRAFDIVYALHAFREARPGMNVTTEPLFFDTWISRSHSYVEELFTKRGTSPLKAGRLAEEVALPRYLGVVRTASAYLDPIEVLLDTTSTERNLNCCAVLVTSDKFPETRVAAAFLAGEYECPLIS
jgi:hypothetical protein